MGRAKGVPICKRRYNPISDDQAVPMKKRRVAGVQVMLRRDLDLKRDLEVMLDFFTSFRAITLRCTDPVNRYFPQDILFTAWDCYLRAVGTLDPLTPVLPSRELVFACLSIAIKFCTDMTGHEGLFSKEVGISLLNQHVLRLELWILKKLDFSISRGTIWEHLVTSHPPRDFEKDLRSLSVGLSLASLYLLGKRQAREIGIACSLVCKEIRLGRGERRGHAAGDLLTPCLRDIARAQLALPAGLVRDLQVSVGIHEELTTWASSILGKGGQEGEGEGVLEEDPE
jgi:hypothetical protein